VVALSAVAACGKQAPPPEQPASPPPAAADEEPPVALNADSLIQYPPRLFDRRVEGDVVLRLFVDSTGHVVPESSRVGESSGYPALDSAAVAGAKTLRYTPARRRGAPVATAFLQRIEFRHPQGDVLQGSPDASTR
jgi:protein TonB